jgi:hypothetical protein
MVRLWLMRQTRTFPLRVLRQEETTYRRAAIFIPLLGLARLHGPEEQGFGSHYHDSQEGGRVIRAVVDTHVLVSALIARKGDEALIVLAIQQGRIQPYFSAAMLEEYAGVLARPKSGFPPDEIAAVLALLLSRK